MHQASLISHWARAITYVLFGVGGESEVDGWMYQCECHTRTKGSTTSHPSNVDDNRTIKLALLLHHTLLVFILFLCTNNTERR